MPHFAGKLSTMKKATGIFVLILAAVVSSAQNSISPPGVYIADPTARVWNDGNQKLMRW
jgi:hypothetical protein